MIVYIAIGIVVASILFLLGWFFNAVDKAQDHIDNNND